MLKLTIAGSIIFSLLSCKSGIKHPIVDSNKKSTSSTPITHKSASRAVANSKFELIIGDWADEESKEVTMTINKVKVTYLRHEDEPVPYHLVGDSLFFDAEDFFDHYLLAFKGTDTMTMTDTLGTTTFHRVKE